MKLFRDEVLQKDQNWLGTVRLARPLSFSVIAAAVGVALLLTVAFLAFGNVTRKAKLAGLLVPAEGSQNITTPQNGVVLERLVHEGQHVEAGETLLVISLERKSLVGGGIENTSEAVAQEISRRQLLVEDARLLSRMRIMQQRQSAQERLAGIDAEMAQTDEAIHLQQQKIALEQDSIERLKPLVASGYLAESKLIEKREMHIDAMSQMQSLTRARSSLMRDRRSLRGEIDNFDVQLKSEANALDVQQSTLKQDELENAARRQLVLTAPSSGTVSAIEIKPGQSVQAGQTLATVLPNTRGGNTLEAQLFAPSRTVGFVRPGQSVYIRYAAFPFQKFGMHEGHIKAISATPFSPSELPPELAQQLLAQNGSTEGLYRISVALDKQTVQAYGEAQALKPGFVLEADVIQARLKLWELMFEPLLAIEKKMQID